LKCLRLVFDPDNLKELSFWWEEYKARKRQHQGEKKCRRQGEKEGYLNKTGLCRYGLYKEKGKREKELADRSCLTASLTTIQGHHVIKVKIAD